MCWNCCNCFMKSKLFNFHNIPMRKGPLSFPFHRVQWALLWIINLLSCIASKDWNLDLTSLTDSRAPVLKYNIFPLSSWQVRKVGWKGWYSLHWQNLTPECRGVYLSLESPTQRSELLSAWAHVYPPVK